jgi:heat shock protein HtpX
MEHRPSLAGRAFAAVALMIGFYVLALGLAALLLYLPYAEMHHLGRLHAKLAIFAVVGAGLILWSIVPRIDRFEAPGPRLTQDDNPDLFQEIGRIARATDQEPPREVYLVPEVNAWVTHRGGFMGFGSRRVMGLGLPLLASLSKPQMRAVLVHEFGHYHGGDVALGPWIYKTRAAIVRTVQNLAEADSWLHKPFEWYGLLFLRLSHAISRVQELAADALAARIAGPDSMAGALRSLASASLGYSAYWQQELAPALSEGLKPPVLAGYQMFVATPKVREQLSAAVVEAEKNEVTDPYDTHPSLRDRLAALAELPRTAAPADAGPSLAWLGNVEREERRLFAFLSAQPGFPRLTESSWEAVAEQVWVQGWRQNQQQLGHHLGEAIVAELPSLLRDPAPLLPALAKNDVQELPEERALERARVALGTAFALQLVDRGYAPAFGPGEPVRLVQEGRTIEPFVLAEQMQKGELDAPSFAEIYRSAGLTGTERLAGAS